MNLLFHPRGHPRPAAAEMSRSPPERESSACLQETGPPTRPRPPPQPVSPPSGFCPLAPAFAARALTRSWEEQLPHATNSIKLPVIPTRGASSLCAATVPPARLRFGREKEAGSRDAKLWRRWSRDSRWVEDERRCGGADSPKISCFQEETCVATILLKDLPKM